MCLILFALATHPEYPLIVAANRDEAYARPTSPAAFWTDHSHVCAGRDLEQGGTWVGIARNGRIAAVTNYRQGVRASRAERSRGELTRDFLTGGAEPAEYLRAVEARGAEYNGFSLLAGTPDALWFYSNRGGAVQKVAPGVHGLSNHLLDEPWPKVRRGIAEMQSLLKANESVLTDRLFQLLADRASAPDAALPATGIARERERALSASFIAGETYGTRASTLVLMRSDGDILFRERSFGPLGVATGETEERFTLEKAASRPSTAQA